MNAFLHRRGKAQMWLLLSVSIHASVIWLGSGANEAVGMSSEPRTQGISIDYRW